MKTILSMVSSLLCAAVFIVLFVFVASGIAILSTKYFSATYEYAVLILDFTCFTLIMMGMLYTMNVFDQLIG